MAEIHQWRGFAALEANLEELGEQVRARGVRRMMSRAAVPMRDDAIRRVPWLKEHHRNRLPGTVARAVRIWRHRTTPFAVTYYVGVRALSRAAISRFKKRFGKAGAQNWNDPFYWRFIEFGVPSRGIRPVAFLRKGFEARKFDAVRIALDEGRDFIRRMRLKRTR